MASILGECTVDQPPGLNKTRGTSKGSWMLTVWGGTGSIPGEGPVSRPPGRFATKRRPAAPKTENEHTVVVMFPQDADREISREFRSREFLPIELGHVL